MDVLGLSTSPSSGGAYALILNEVEGSRRLPIIIGTFEAQAIALELEHIKPPRPMTHDLLRNIIQSFGTTVKFISISDLRESTYYAEIVYEYEGSDVSIDARPSDAIALAIRFNAPIYVEKKVLDEAGIDTDTPDEQFDEVKSEPSPVKDPSPVEKKQSRLELLEQNLSKAIAEEDYELAARIRDEMSRLKD